MSDLRNYSIYDIAKHLIMLLDAAWKDGFFAMELVLEDSLMPALLNHAIRLIMDGTESEIILAIINRYIETQNLNKEDLVKAWIIKNGIEDILFTNTSPIEMLVSMVKDLSDNEIIQLMNLINESDL